MIGNTAGAGGADTPPGCGCINTCPVLRWHEHALHGRQSASASASVDMNTLMLFGVAEAPPSFGVMGTVLSSRLAKTHS